ncbi:hypothetical protein NDA01_29340 [Trichocoleus desertorum AS-A10]|uniref:hypothetical protein n=1 Tax=Trichocoleus desertorum TaxID=1481672 RepID=UPI003296D9C2
MDMEEENGSMKNADSEIENKSSSHITESIQSSSLIIKDSKLKVAIANTCLLIWAILLAVIGMQAVSGKASTVILDIAEAFVPRKKTQVLTLIPNFTIIPQGQDFTVISGSQVEKALSQDEVFSVMSEHIEKRYSEQDETSIPPIAIVLDRLQVNVNWRDAIAIDDANGSKMTAPGRRDYENLFDIVAKRLESIADFSPKVSEASNLKISNNIMPLKFRATKTETPPRAGTLPSPNEDTQKFEKFKEQEIELPVEAVLWVKERQASTTARKSQIDFLDLFILLIILGGFGSWIYLVRRHIDPSTKVDLYEYFYRPPLGMTLAIAVFIVNITLHSFVSNSDINEVRRETLILLAFTAGLLSDKTYEFIEKATGEKLGHRRLEDDLERESK